MTGQCTWTTKDERFAILGYTFGYLNTFSGLFACALVVLTRDKLRRGGHPTRRFPGRHNRIFKALILCLLGLGIPVICIYRAPLYRKHGLAINEPLKVLLLQTESTLVTVVSGMAGLWVRQEDKAGEEAISLTDLPSNAGATDVPPGGIPRSEERRVGKECPV